MEQRKVKILWIDDDIFRLKLQPYIDEFNDNGFEIIGVANPDDINEAIASNSDIQCIILDVSMPTGENIEVNEAKKGMRTGLVVLKILKENTSLNQIKKVIFTIVTDEEVRKYCDSNSIPYLSKQENSTDIFLEKISEIINKK
jgi:DNA-binding NtrC family response regulator